MTASTKPLLELLGARRDFGQPSTVRDGLTRLFGGTPRASVVHAVDGVDVSIEQGEVVGLIGESGCGKSTLARLAAGLLPLTAGIRRYRGEMVEPPRKARARKHQLSIQMVFQDPYASLNPRSRVQTIIAEAPVVHGLIKPVDQRDTVLQLLEQVGLDASALERYPHQFSGGQRARIGIARALAVKPELLVLDEAVAALDVSIQAQLLNLFEDLKARLGLTYLFISHDLGVVRYLADRVMIMYLGRIVEVAQVAELFAAPNHPYSQALLAQAPTLKVEKRVFTGVSGEIPSPLDPPSGCRFHPRCKYAMARCTVDDPVLVQIAPGRFSACHLNDLSPEQGGAQEYN